MNNILHRLRSTLSWSKIYDLFQVMMGAQNLRRYISEKYIRAQNGDTILDIGCGTGEILSYLPRINYYGFDSNSRYIESAKKKYSRYPGVKFLCENVYNIEYESLPKLDIVLAVAVLHHLDDNEAAQLVKLAKYVLKENGRLITLDCCYEKNQSPVARFLASQDRGRYVRDINQYHELMIPFFKSVSVNIHHDLLRFPYTHIIMECAD